MPKRLRISVALCTHQGAAHLPEQLQSILAQSRLPDELVAHDDRSSDQTLSILQQFAATAPFAVKLAVNDRVLGPAQNFASAIADCTGDLIVLSDQDDLWMADRLALTEQTFLSRPNLGLLFSDAQMCDEDGQSLGYRLWQSVPFPRSLQRRLNRDASAGGDAFDILLRQNIATGATMAFATDLRPLVLPVDAQWMHDGWIALLAAAVAPVAALTQPLIHYRQHPQQNIGAARRTFYQQYRAAKQMDRDIFHRHAQMYQAALDRLRQATERLNMAIPPHVFDQLERKIAHYRRRSAIRLRQSSRLLSLVELLSLRYRRYSLGYKSFAQDLLL